MSPGPKRSVCWQGFGLPKRGHAADEYEDAYAADPDAGRFAVADGASESSFASLWAQLLVEEFVHPASRRDSPNGWLAPLRQRWEAEVDGRPLPWYAEAKRAEGAFATFLGLALRRAAGHGRGGHWRALAIGDSCFFQVRANRLVRAFPLTGAEDFGNRPDLLCSRARANHRLKPRRRRAQGRWQAGDCFFLATDALAEWFLRRHEEGLKPWQMLEAGLRGPSAEAAFAAWVEERRSGQALRNDDVTLLWVVPGEPPAADTAVPPDATAGTE